MGTIIHTVDYKVDETPVIVEPIDLRSFRRYGQDGVLALLTDDAWLSMPPAPHQYQGLAAIRSFLEASFAFRGERPLYLIPGRGNNQSSFASYLSDQLEPVARPAGLFVLTLADDHIGALARFHFVDPYPLLGFPASLTP